MLLAALSREGIAGVWGVCGESGFPGEDEVDTDVGGIIGGTLESCRLDEPDEPPARNKREEDIESDNSLFESRMRWKRVSAAVVLRVEASVEAASEGVRRSFFRSSILRKSEMFSSSSWTEPELPPPTSASRPEPGCAEDVALPLPLLVWSSSVLVVPPEDNRPRRWLKLLLYLVMGAGFGELEAEEVTALSGSFAPCFGAVPEGYTDGAMPLASFREARTGALAKEVRGEPAKGDIIAGEADKDGVLNGWKDMDGRRALPTAPSTARSVGREL
jgi:hypothetical protein